MRTYADYVLKYMPWIVDNLGDAIQTRGGNVMTSLSSFLTAIRQIDAASLAEHQLPVLKEYANKTSGAPTLLEYHRNYMGWIKEMEYLSKA